MLRRIVVGLAVGMLSASTVFAQAAAPAAPNPFVFNEDGGVILNFVKADKTADFEMVMGKLKEALAKSEKPERKAQAAGWKYFKASEAGPGGAAIYVFIMDPVAKGSEYSVGNILVEVFGAEGQALYKTYSDSYANPAIGALLHLTKVAELGK
ncbi:MAG TPA: hypothetical protein VKI43_08090 [Vicinamibacterales bacterium]|nr:hypothetical protein [Vicinamibacterales bacterium]